MAPSLASSRPHQKGRRGGPSHNPPPPPPPTTSPLITTRILSSKAIQGSLNSLTSSLLDALITPWWSRISPTNNQALHDEVERLVGLIGTELSKRLQDAEAQGRLEVLFREEVPALLQRYIEVCRAASLGLEQEEHWHQRQGHPAKGSQFEGDKDEEEAKAQDRSRRLFQVYTALWPSVYVEIGAPSPGAAASVHLSLARIRSLADAILPLLLPAEEVQSRAAAALVRDLLAMLLRIAIEKGSSGWMLVRIAQKQVVQIVERAKKTKAEDEIVFLPSTQEMKDWALLRWKRILPSAQKTLQVCREYALSLASSRTDNKPANYVEKEKQPPSYHERATPSCQDMQTKSSHLRPSVSSNYLSLLSALLDLESTFSGRLVQGMLLLARHFGSARLDSLITTSFTPHLQDESLYLSLLKTLRQTLLQPNGTLPPPSSIPCTSIQKREYEEFLSAVDEQVLPLLCQGQVVEEIARFVLLGQHQHQPHPQREHSQKQQVKDEELPSPLPLAYSHLHKLLDPLFSPEACWTRADLMARLLERVIRAIFPELGEGGGDD